MACKVCRWNLPATPAVMRASLDDAAEFCREHRNEWKRVAPKHVQTGGFEDVVRANMPSDIADIVEKAQARFDAWLRDTRAELEHELSHGLNILLGLLCRRFGGELVFTFDDVEDLKKKYRLLMKEDAMGREVRFWVVER